MRSANSIQGSGSAATAGLLCHTLRVFYEVQESANENRPSERVLGGASLCLKFLFRLILCCGVRFFI